jgi:excisionase family DNA binding protein
VCAGHGWEDVTNVTNVTMHHREQGQSHRATSCRAHLAQAKACFVAIRRTRHRPRFLQGVPDEGIRRAQWNAAGGLTMAINTPTDAPRTSDPTAPPSESPARSIGTNHRRRPQPHHRPSSTTPQLDGFHELIRELIRQEVRIALAAARPAPDEYFTTAEAARHAKVAPRSIRRWLHQGKLRALHAGRELRIRRADLDELMRSGRRGNASELTPEQLAERDFG